MSVYGSVIPGASRLAGIGVELSKAAKLRLRWMDYYEQHGEDAPLTCRYFGIPPKTFWKWRKGYNRYDLTSLEDRSRRPHTVRQRSWSATLVLAVRALREQYPRWGKDKLVVLLRREGHQVSASMVGRILTYLRQQGVLREPVRLRKRSRRRALSRPYAVRKPRDYLVRDPGDLVQLDTQEQRIEPGVTLRHFGARDMVSRWDVLSVHSRATALVARDFLGEVLQRMPFPVKAVQIDGGSEFKAEFEEACREYKVRLFVLPPKSPKLNGRVERSHRTHEEEFYQCYAGELTVVAITPALRQWERVYDTVRPHQALGYRTPAEYVRAWRHRNENRTARATPRSVPSPV